MVTEILKSIACAASYKTAQCVSMIGECGSRHTVISLSISTLGFNYLADAHTIPPLCQAPDNCPYSSEGAGRNFLNKNI